MKRICCLFAIVVCVLFFQAASYAVPGPISGSSAVCAGGTMTLSDATAGGTWSSSATGIATIGSGTGIVTGIAGGTTTISYTDGTGSAIKVITINPSPAPVTITPPSAAVCLGSSSVFTAGTSVGGTILSQNFNTGMIGAVGGAWTVVNSGATSTYNWAITPPTGYPDEGFAGDGSPYMNADPDATGSGVTLITSLQSPVFSTVGYSAATLSFNYYCNSSIIYDVSAEIDYSTNGGVTWTAAQYIVI